MKVNILIVTICIVSFLTYKYFSANKIDWTPDFKNKVSMICHEEGYQTLLKLSGNAKDELSSTNDFKEIVKPLLDNICECSVEEMKGDGDKLDGVKNLFIEGGKFTSEFEQKIIRYLSSAKGTLMLTKCIHQGTSIKSFLDTNEFMIRKRFIASCVKTMNGKVAKHKYSEQYSRLYCECTSNKFFDENEDLFSPEENSTPEKKLNLLSRVIEKAKEFNNIDDNQKLISECSKYSLGKLPEGKNFLESKKKKSK
jgi:hypothetical protein